jgi:hypothetical protein
LIKGLQKVTIDAKLKRSTVYIPTAPAYGDALVRINSGQYATAWHGQASPIGSTGGGAGDIILVVRHHLWTEPRK